MFFIYERQAQTVKFAWIGQDIPMLLPAMLADLLFAGKEPAEIAIHENNPAMTGVLENYGSAVIARSGLPASLRCSDTIPETLAGADCVVYAGDCMPASRFRMDREALSGLQEDDPGLTEQARVNGGLGGLLHTLRNGSQVLDLCDDMAELAPNALVICLGQPVARLTELFLLRGFDAYGLGHSPLSGPNGVRALCRKLGRDPQTVRALTAGLPGFAFLLKLTDAATGANLMPQVLKLSESGDLGRLTPRWFAQYGAIPVGDVTEHAEFLPAQPDYEPDPDPVFSETIEQRKERILSMNTVGRAGTASPEGALAQVKLLRTAPPVRPVQLALDLLRGLPKQHPAVARRNGHTIPRLPEDAVIQADLDPLNQSIDLPEALSDVCASVSETNHLAALAAAGDRTALRECIENDPALDGLDRLYCQDVAARMIELHSDVLPRWQNEVD